MLSPSHPGKGPGVRALLLKTFAGHPTGKPFLIEIAQQADSAAPMHSSPAVSGRNSACRGLLPGIAVWSSTVA